MQKPSEIRYREVPHYGEIFVNRIERREALGLESLALATEVQRVKREAWAEAAWFAEAMGGDRAAIEKANELFGNPQKQRLQIIKSVVLPWGNTFYRAGVWEPEFAANNVAMGRFRQDVSGNPAERAAKHTLRTDKEYACVGDLNTLPNFQGSGVGLAVLHAGLLGMHPDRLTTTYVASTKQKQIGRLIHYGFEITGDHPRPDLYGEKSDVREVRLLGPSVRVFSALLEEAHPHLESAEISY